MTSLLAFFNTWDQLEAANPFGVMRLYQFLTNFGVSEHMARDVDEFLFMDLVSYRQINIRRIKVQARATNDIFWVYIDLQTSILGFQATPISPFTYAATIIPEPVWLIRMILAYYNRHHRRAIRSPQRHRRFDAYLRRSQ